MRIAFLTASVSRKAGGLYDAVRQLAMGLHGKNGMALKIFGLEEPETLDDLAGWGGIPVVTASVVGPRAFGYAPELFRELCTAEPDVVHQHGLWMYPSISCRRWYARTRRPYIISSHGMLDPWALRNSAWKKRMAGWLYENGNLQGSACLHALNEAEAKAMRSHGLRNPIAVIPNGVDVPEHPVVDTPSWADQLQPSEKVMLFLGRLHPKKGLSNLLRAWKDVKQQAEGGGWRLVIAGWDQGGHENELRTLAVELGLRDSVLFAGPQFGREKGASLAQASAFILPSYSEGLPMAVLEAWAHGLPVIMTPYCNIPEGFEAGAAVEIEPQSKSLARKLDELFIMADATRMEMGIKGRLLVEEKFCWKRVAKEMGDVYTWVTCGGSVPRSVSLFQG